MTRLLISAAVGIVLTLSLQSVSLGDMTAEEVMADVEAKAAKVASFKATMTTTMEMMGQQVTTPAVILFKKPNKTRVEVSNPMFPDMKQITISDGDTAWQYSPDMNLVTRTDLKQMRETMRNAPGSFAGRAVGDITRPFEGMNKDMVHYAGKRQLEAQEMYVFDLKLPLQDPTNNPFLPARVQVWIGVNDGLQHKLISYNRDGAQMMVVRFSNFETNIDIPDATFIFTPPADAQIVDMSQGAANTMMNFQEEQEP